MEKADIETSGRQMSVVSREAVDAVGALGEQLREMKSKLEALNGLLEASGSTVKDLLDAKLEVAQIVGGFDKFQFNQVDSIITAGLNSGKEEVRQRRKELTSDVTFLRERAVKLHNALGARIVTMGGPAGTAEG